jgi:CDP-diacylglycerol--serine O-phosphatidyltransferase
MRHLPNFLTCCNLFCGTLGVLHIFRGADYPVAYFVWLACIFDFLDGLVARALKIKSPIGKELDSLADVVSFGLLPSLFMFTLISGQTTNPFLPYTAILIVICSALRLAIFNVDESQSDSFKGLPTPANALFLTGLPFLQFDGLRFLFQPVLLCIISIIFSVLLVSRMNLFALKFKDFSWQANKVRFTFIALAVLLLVGVKFAAIPLVIILYILLSLGVLLVPEKKAQ